jgi:hypothetical protein
VGTVNNTGYTIWVHYLGTLSGYTARYTHISVPTSVPTRVQASVPTFMLTDAKIRQAKPRQNPYKLYDAGGLFLIVSPRGGKWWRLRYTLDGKEKVISLGTYPAVSLKRARAARDEARAVISSGVHPSASKKSDPDTFESVAREWHERYKPA